jgi:hypothetical protein
MSRYRIVSMEHDAGWTEEGKAESMYRKSVAIDRRTIYWTINMVRPRDFGCTLRRRKVGRKENGTFHPRASPFFPHLDNESRRLPTRPRKSLEGGLKAVSPVISLTSLQLPQPKCVQTALRSERRSEIDIRRAELGPLSASLLLPPLLSPK